MKARIGISLGCPCGVGPEVVEKALADPRVRDAVVPMLFGRTKGFTPGKPNAKAGRVQHEAVLGAVEAAKDGVIDAICTAPVSKEQIINAGIPFTGHTELLAQAFGVDVLMLMAGPRLNVALATNHLPLSKVPKAITKKKLVQQLELLARTHRRIAVCGLNPHAGEGGKMGREEVDVIAPAIAAARKKGIDVAGPFPADGLFAKAQAGIGYDAVLAMFHDQGLCVAKALDFRTTVNVTLGLPLPRTSPDHGTAYDIAGQGKADPEPMIQALLMAVKLTGIA